MYYNSKQRTSIVLYYKSKQRCYGQSMYNKSKQSIVLQKESKQRCYDQSIALQKYVSKDVLPMYCNAKENKVVMTKVLHYK